MKIGDKVKPIRGNYAGVVGIVTKTIPMAMSFTFDDTGEEKAEYEDYCACKAENGKIFYCWEGDLELVE